MVCVAPQSSEKMYSDPADDVRRPRPTAVVDFKLIVICFKIVQRFTNYFQRVFCVSFHFRLFFPESFVQRRSKESDLNVFPHTLVHQSAIFSVHQSAFLISYASPPIGTLLHVNPPLKNSCESKNS